MPGMYNPFMVRKQLSPLQPPMDDNQEEDNLDFSSIPYEMPDMQLPQTPMRNQYLSALMETPQPEDYAPSTGRKILSSLLGGLAGIGGRGAQGLNLSQSILEAPYAGAVRQHAAKLAPLKEAEDIEEKDTKESIANMRDQYRYMKDKNTHMLNAMKAESAHRKRMADIENMKDDNARAEAIRKETIRHNRVLENLRGQYQEFQKVREKNRQGRFESAQAQRERFHADKSGDDKPLPEKEQERIHGAAVESVRNDERFKEFWHQEGDKLPDGTRAKATGFHIPNDDEDTKKALGEAIIREEAKVAKRTRKSYADEAFKLDLTNMFEDDPDNEPDDDEDD